MIDIKSLKDKITSTIYPNGKGAINAADHQSLLIEMADNMAATDLDVSNLASNVALTEGCCSKLIAQLKLQKQGYYTYTGGFGDTPDAMNTGLVPILDYEHLDWATNAGGIGAYVGFFDVDRKFISSLVIRGNGTLESGSINLKSSEYSNVKYVCLSYYDTTKAFKGFKCQLYNSENLEKQIEAVSDKTDATYSDLNISDNALIEQGYYTYTGGFGDTPDAMNTGLIPVLSFQYLNWATNAGSIGAYVGFYDKDQKYIANLVIRGDGTLKSGLIDLTEEEYADVHYVRLSYYDTTRAFKGFKCQLYNKSIAYDIQEIKKTQSDSAGLKLLIFGDSITDAATITYDAVEKVTTSYDLGPNSNYFVDTDGKTKVFSMWSYLLTTRFNCTDVRNYAQGGATYKSSEKAAGYERQNLAFQIDLAINDKSNPKNVFPTQGEFQPDIIIFALGTNDGGANDTFESAMSKTILDSAGNVDVDATIANLDLTKMCEAMRAAYLRVIQAFPYAQRFCVLPIQRVAYDVQTISNPDIRRMAERYAISIIDGASESGVVPEFEKKNDLGMLLKDGLHPNEKGQIAYARMIARYIKQYIPF